MGKECSAHNKPSITWSTVGFDRIEGIFVIRSQSLLAYTRAGTHTHTHTHAHTHTNTHTHTHTHALADQVARLQCGAGCVH